MVYYYLLRVEDVSYKGSNQKHSLSPLLLNMRVEEAMEEMKERLEIEKQKHGERCYDLQMILLFPWKRGRI